MPAMLWIVLQKLHEAALWLWQHTPGSRDISPAQPLHVDAAMAASSLSARSGQQVVRVASQPQRLSELDELIRVCDIIGRERRELVS